MSTEVKVPVLPESVSDATVATWHKKAGDKVSRDENLVDLETDKVMLEVPAPEDGVLKEIVKEAGETVTAEEVIAIIEAGEGGGEADEGEDDEGEEKESGEKEEKPAEKEEKEDKPAAKKEEKAEEKEEKKESKKDGGGEDQQLSPAARRLIEENDLDSGRIEGTGRGGLVTKGDVIDFMESGDKKQKKSGDGEKRAAPEAKSTQGDRPEKRVPMSRMRARIAERMVEAQTEAAMLTSFNEVNLKAVMDIRKRYKEQFEKKHGVRLGLMSFFVKAVIEGLRKHPVVNASVEESDIIYHQFYDIGIAVSTERGLVVPILRNADRMSLADVENQIGEYARKAREGGLSLDDLKGGTFTITNGGVFGSLISTPILNPPQSAILGMHTIKERAVVEDGEIVARPMMYIALTYDHRIIDGKDAVLFLVAVKEALEDPHRMLLNL
jgi:2-oxoglutarate dehydrogenase E2 component (dihydrolipoamide succinyltransferase)